LEFSPNQTRFLAGFCVKLADLSPKGIGNQKDGNECSKSLNVISNVFLEIHHTFVNTSQLKTTLHFAFLISLFIAISRSKGVNTDISIFSRLSLFLPLIYINNQNSGWILK
jgi:hypothetical protein